MNNVIGMEQILNDCSTLSSLPNINIWNNNTAYYNNIFDNCFSVINIPLKDFNKE